jgi:hypothetical protein
MFTGVFFSNNKTPKSIFIVVRNASERIHGIYRVTAYPLFKEYELSDYAKLNKQQLQSQKYYIETNYKREHLVYGTFDSLISNAIRLLNTEENYDFGNYKQIKNYVNPKRMDGLRA